MDSDFLKQALEKEKKKYIEKTFDELANINKPITYECGEGDIWYQVEVQLLEKTKEYVHVSIAVDKGKGITAFIPVTDDFLVYKDGRVDA